MEILVSDRSLQYTGRELRHHWIFEEFGLRGDAAVAWIGPCFVEIEDLVDIEDADAGSGIASDAMLHILVEHFLHPSLLLAVHRQHLLAALAGELFFEESGILPSRRGNDLYIGNAKLSVSIATVSPVSSLIHLGLNITTEGTPVVTSCFDDHDVDPIAFAHELLERYMNEVNMIISALCKVHPR